MTHPLVTRLSDDLGWPLFDDLDDLTAWVSRPGVHVLFVPGTQRWNLEAPDVAIILPELQMAFQGQFDCAVVDDAIETAVRTQSGVHKTPSLILYRKGTCLGGIPKVRDWDDYIARMTRFLARPIAAE
ncbi:MAG: hydrogenase accessory protein [Pseudomonadota bacterium]